MKGFLIAKKINHYINEQATKNVYKVTAPIDFK